MERDSKLRSIWQRIRTIFGFGTEGTPPDPLREFVYLDEVSVMSLLASQEQHGALIEQLTESESHSLTSEVKGSLDVPSVSFGSSSASSEESSTQVLRKMTIQSRFKQLRQKTIAQFVELTPTAVSQPSEAIHMPGDLDLLRSRRQILAPSDLHRGILIEAQCRVSTDAIFQFSTVMKILRDVLEENKDLATSVEDQIGDIVAMDRLFSSLLEGLVPIRATLTDYEWVNVSGSPHLVHSSVLGQVTSALGVRSHPVVVAGVAERGLFWKDLRRTMFPHGDYVVFARIATSGLLDEWIPIKMEEVLVGIFPEFGEHLAPIRHIASRAIADGLPSDLNALRSEEVVVSFADRLAEYHKTVVPAELSEKIRANAPSSDSWLQDTSLRREILGEVQSQLEAQLGLEATDSAIASDIRLDVSRRVDPATSVTHDHSASLDRDKKFLHCEFIAMYW